MVVERQFRDWITKCEVRADIGATNAVAFDLHAACSGFLFSMNTAAAYMQSGVYKNALVIGAETLSKMMDWTDRGTCVLFGDGAGAAVGEISDEFAGMWKYFCCKCSNPLGFFK